MKASVPIANVAMASRKEYRSMLIVTLATEG